MPGYTSPLLIPYPVSADTMQDALSVIPQQQAEKVDDLLVAYTGVAPVSWVSPALAAGWAALGDVGLGPEATRYARGASMVTLLVAQTKASIGANEALLSAALPVGYRPAHPIRALGQYSGVIRLFHVLPSGVVASSVATTSGIIGSVSFYV